MTTARNTLINQCTKRSRAEVAPHPASVLPMAACLRGGAGSSSDFSGEIGRLLFDAFTHLEADEAGDLHRGAAFLGSGSHHVGDLALAVDDEHLFHQHHFFVVLADAAFD